MSRTYTASFEGSGTTAQVDFFEYTVPTGQTLRLLSVHVGQSSDAGDAESEMLKYEIKAQQGGTSGSGGSTASIRAADPSVSSSIGNVEVLNTTPATGTTEEFIHRDAFHVAAGLHYVPTPEEMHDVKGGDRLVVKLTKTPADSIDFVGTINFSLTGA